MKTSGLVVLKQTESAYAAARAMKDHNVGCVLVSDNDGKLVGIVTDRDIILRSVCDNRDARDLELKFVMSKAPVTASESDDVERVIHLMRSLGVRRVPVVNSQGKPVRIVTLDDLVLSQKADLDSLRGVVVHQISQSARLRPLPRSKQFDDDDEGFARIARSSGAYSLSPEQMRIIAEEGSQESARSSGRGSRVQQTLGKFLHTARDCLEAKNIFGLEKECVALGMDTFLKTLIRAMNPASAGNFIAQLPSAYHETLLAEPAGPDQQISRRLVERAVRMSMALKADQASDAVAALCEAVALSVSPGEAQHLVRVLPNELSRVFQEALKARAA